MASPAAILDILLVANTAQANAALAKTQAQLSATGKTATATSATMKKALLGVGVAAAAAGTALFKIGEEFDDAYDKIRVRTGATGKEMKKLKQAFRDVASDVPGSFDDAAEAVGGLNQRLELTGKPLRRVSKQITELSRLTGTDVESNVRTVSRAFVDWEVATKDQSKTLDGFFRLSRESGLAVQDIAESVQKFGSPLRQLGFTLEESAAMFATFEKAGVNAQTMVPGFKLAISNLTRPTDLLADSMEKLGIKAGDPEKALKEVMALLSGDTISQVEKVGLTMDVFGKRAGPDMAEAIKQGRFELDKFVKVMEDGQGSILETGRKTMDAAEHFDVLKKNVMLALEPLAKDVFKGLGDLMKDITDAFKKGGINEVIDLLAQKLADAAPKVAEAGLKLGGALIKGIWDAFWGTNLLGKLFIGAAAFKLFGGAASIAKAGRAVGFAFAHPMVLAIGATVGSFALGWEFGKDSFVTQTKKGDEAIQAVADDLGVTFDRARKLQRFLQNNPGLGINEAMEATKTPFELATELDITMNKAKKLRDWMRGNPGLSAPDALKSMNAAARVTRELWDSAMGTIRKESDRTGDTMMQVFARATGKVIGDFVNTKDKGKDSTFDLAKGVAMNIGSLAGAVGAGMANVKENTNKSLGAFGVDPLSYAIKKVGNLLGAQKRQAGGVIVPGQGSGDKVPAMLEPGELVVNKRAVAALGGAQKANRINRLIPRFAKGGVAGGLNFALGPYDIPPIQYAADHAGGNSHVHITGTSTPWVVGIGKKLQQMGMMVGEHPAFGGVNAQHSATGGHYDALAIDVNTAADETRGEVARIAAILKGSGVSGAAAEKIARMVLKGPKGPLRSMGQGALDKVRGAANKFLSRQAPSGVAPKGGGALSKSQIQRLWSSVNPGVGNANLMAAIALAESSGNPAAHGPPDGRGLWQIEWPIWGSSLGKYGNPYNAADNARMARDVLQQQGLGAWVVYNTGAYQQFLQKGGIAGAQKGMEVGSKGSLGISNKLRRQLQRLRRRAGTIDEQILIAETAAGFPTSEAGSDLGPREITGLVGRHRELLGNLTTRASLIGKVLKRLPRRNPMARKLREELIGLQGSTGGAGRILETQAAIADLLGQGTTAVDTGPQADLLSEMLRQANLRYAVSQAQYGVFAGGGVAPPMVTPSITPTVGNADVKIYDYGGGSREVSVNGQMIDPRKVVEAGGRRAGRRPLPSARGY